MKPAPPMSATERLHGEVTLVPPRELGRRVGRDVLGVLGLDVRRDGQGDRAVADRLAVREPRLRRSRTSRGSTSCRDRLGVVDARADALGRERGDELRAAASGKPASSTTVRQ